MVGELFLTAYLHFAPSTFALIASIGAVNVWLGNHFTYKVSFLVYLPLADVLEYIMELFVGVPCGYGRVETPLSGTAKEI